MNCSICLEEFNNTKTIFKLSCNHQLHYECFLRYSYQVGHLFIDCPMCREMNINTQLPNLDTEQNLRELLFHKKKKRCCASNNTNGKRCKKNAIVMNYGFCEVHHDCILPKDKYDLMIRYIFNTLQIKCSWYSKINFIDMTKKLLIRYPEIKTFDEILSYGFRYKFHLLKMNLNDEIIDRKGIYNYYQIMIPPPNWIKKCLEKKIID